MKRKRECKCHTWAKRWKGGGGSLNVWDIGEWMNELRRRHSTVEWRHSLLFIRLDGGKQLCVKHMLYIDVDFDSRELIWKFRAALD